MENTLMQTRNWIDGEWTSAGGETLSVKNPSNIEEEVGVVHFSTAEEALQAAQAAKQALSGWSTLTAAARGEYLYRLASVLQAHVQEVAELASREMGKPLTEMRGEVMRGVHILRYYAAEGVRPNGSVIPSNEASVLQYTKRVPLGVVGIITPWNFPIAIPLWKIVPALICGNTVVWKPAEIASLTATRLTELFEEAGFPAGVFNLVIGQGNIVGSALLAQAPLDAVSFTGSTATGQQIAVACAQRNIKFQTEMGGKNVAIVLNDAQLEKTVPIILSGAFRSAGQKCTATARIIAQKEIYAPLREALREAIAKLEVGQALNPAVYLGPVASSDQYKKVMSFVDLAQKDGEILVKGKSIVDMASGYYIQPTVVEGVGVDHPLVQDEIFGPVSVLLPTNSFEESIQICNQTVYGLSASLFTQDLGKAMQFLDKAEAGMVRVNQETAGVEYQAPFGGMKQSSSHSREQGQAALDFYSQVKTCAISYSF